MGRTKVQLVEKRFRGVLGIPKKKHYTFHKDEELFRKEKKTCTGEINKNEFRIALKVAAMNGWGFKKDKYGPIHGPRNRSPTNPKTMLDTQTYSQMDPKMGTRLRLQRLKRNVTRKKT